MKSIDIHGKKYYPVVERVKEFRKDYPDGYIKTKIISITDDSVLVKATIFSNETQYLSTGHAYEKQSWGKINVRSMVENAETSAVGRALGFLGIGIEDDIASADEMKGTDEPLADFAQISMIETLLAKAAISDKVRNDIELELGHFTKTKASSCITYLKENQVEGKLDDELTKRLDREP